MLSHAAALMALCSVAYGANYAVLVAGSNSYMNYRHQADIAHAYQILTQGGIPADNIITMMYDDVAGSSENPFPGKLFNKPTTGEGWDVYQGVKIDYKGDDCTAANFLAVLTGNSTKTGGKKVLKTTKDDKVFVNFADHGGTGIIAFPSGPYLGAADLITALKTMHSKQMYKELVFYMEACESGSMFADLPKDMDIYAVTAANADESSYGTYCPPNDKVNGKELNSCLGDLFSVNWMEDADKTDLRSETLSSQYTKVKQLTTESHVMQFGQLTITVEDASQYEGRGSVHNDTQTTVANTQSSVDSRDIALVTLYHRYLRASDDTRSQAATALVAEINSREKSDSLFRNIRRAVSPKQEVLTHRILHPSCYDQVHEALRQCGGYSDYALKYVKTMKSLCDSTNGATSSILAAIASHC